LCVDSCPKGAIGRNRKTGAVVVDEEKCSGCGLCVLSCPLGILKVDRVTHVAIKCDLCGGDPECVKRCPEKALQFIDAEKAAHYRQRAFAKLFEKAPVAMKPFPR
jgi:Fe-S-cluster-containing hydrogenase component 2